MTHSIASDRAAEKSETLGLVRGLIVVLFFTAFYGLTAQRGVSWQDSGRFQYRVIHGLYNDGLGLALAHPLYIGGGRVVLWIGGREHLPFLLNAFSGLGMAVALGFLAATCTMLTGRRWIGLLITAMLGLMHSAWWLATIAEVYTWSVAGLTAELLLLTMLLRHPRAITLIGLAFLSGLGLCVHNFALLPLPVYGIVALVLVIRRRLPAWSLVAAAGVYLLGAGMYIAMIVQRAMQEGHLSAAVASALVGKYNAQVTNIVQASKHWKENAVLSGMNFLNPVLPLAVAGWIRFRRRLGGALAAALGAITLIEFVFFVRYPVPDQFTFILPSLTMLAVAAAVGLAVLADAGRGVRGMVVALCLLSLTVQPVLYSIAPTLAERFQGPPPARQPFRDEWRYWLTPWKQNEQSAAQFSRFVLENANPRSIVVLTSTTSLPPLSVYLLTTEQPHTVTAMSPGQLQFLKQDDPQFYETKLLMNPIYMDSIPPAETIHELFGSATFTPCLDGLLYCVEPIAPRTLPGE